MFTSISAVGSCKFKFIKLFFTSFSFIRTWIISKVGHLSLSELPKKTAKESRVQEMPKY